MKRKCLLKIAVIVSLVLWCNTVFSAPLDWSGFESDDLSLASLDSNNTTLNFSEDIDYLSVYYYNDGFIVPSTATILSFNYEITLLTDDHFDYLTFEMFDTYGDTILMDEFGDPVDYVEFPGVNNSTLSGSYSVDLTNYQDAIISIAWGFIEDDFDEIVGSSARILDIDLAEAAAPVPSPQQCC